MLPLKEYEPPCRRLRIRNRKRLFVTLLIVVCVVSALLIRPAESQTEYEPYTVSYGDTYWGIAQELQAAGYKANKDIRAVVDELVRESGIPAHELRDGDVIRIPKGVWKWRDQGT